MTVLRPGRLQRDGLFGGLIVIFVLALVRGLAGAQTSAGRVAVIVFAALVIAGLLAAWIVQLARPSRLEVTAQAVTLVDARGKRTTLSREAGDELKVVISGGGRYRRRGLTIAGSGTVIPLGFFSLTQVQRAATAAGWRLTKPGRRAS
jgi:HAMP domain-containing protein